MTAKKKKKKMKKEKKEKKKRGISNFWRRSLVHFFPPPPFHLRCHRCRRSHLSFLFFFCFCFCFFFFFLFICWSPLPIKLLWNFRIQITFFVQLHQTDQITKLIALQKKLLSTAAFKPNPTLRQYESQQRRRLIWALNIGHQKKEKKKCFLLLFSQNSIQEVSSIKMFNNVFPNEGAIFIKWLNE